MFLPPLRNRGRSARPFCGILSVRPGFGEGDIRPALSQASTRHPEVRAEGAPEGWTFLVPAAAPSRAAELVIGPATSGRTRWRTPQDDGKCAAIRKAIALAAPLRARVMPTPSREERRPGSLRESPRGGAPVSQGLTPSPPFPFQRRIKIGSRTPTDAGTTAAPYGRGAAQRGGSSVGVPPRLSPKGVVVPKAQLQARFPGTWSDAGVTRLRLSQSREHPPPRS